MSETSRRYPSREMVMPLPCSFFFLLAGTWIQGLELKSHLGPWGELVRPHPGDQKNPWKTWVHDTVSQGRYQTVRSARNSHPLSYRLSIPHGQIIIWTDQGSHWLAWGCRALWPGGLLPPSDYSSNSTLSVKLWNDYRENPGEQNSQTDMCTCGFSFSGESKGSKLNR